MVNKEDSRTFGAGRGGFCHTACSGTLFFNTYSYKHNCISKKRWFSHTYVIGDQVQDSIDCAWEVVGCIWVPWADLWQRAAVIKGESWTEAGKELLLLDRELMRSIFESFIQFRPVCFQKCWEMRENAGRSHKKYSEELRKFLLVKDL